MLDRLSQSGFIMAALLAGFVLYLALQNRLGVYWNLLIGGSGSSTSSTSSGTYTGSTGPFGLGSTGTK